MMLILDCLISGLHEIVDTLNGWKQKLEAKIKENNDQQK